MTEIMTNEQFRTILQMIRMILDSCEDVASAKAKIDALLRDASGGKDKAE